MTTQGTAHDLVIRGGLVVDGTGAPGRRADVAVRDGKLSEIGAVTGRGAREIPAAGPGAVDDESTANHQIVGRPLGRHGGLLYGNCMVLSLTSDLAARV